MACPRMIRWFLLLLLLALPAYSALAETVELVTYYPASASSEDLHARSLTVGTPYLGTAPMPDGMVAINNGLWVGNGYDPTNNPLAAGTLLQLVGTGNQSIELRTYADAGGNGDASLRLHNYGSNIMGFTVFRGTDPGGACLAIEDVSGGVPRVEIARFSRSGDVGIGTTTPTERLVIAGDSSADDSTWGNAALELSNTNASGRNFALSSRDQPSGGTAHPSFVISDETAGQIRFLINDSGNVGIGTTTPAAKLNIAGDSSADDSTWTNAALLITDTNAGGRVFGLSSRAAGGGSFVISDETAGAERLVINKNGRVLVGSPPPSNLFAPLELNVSQDMEIIDPTAAYLYMESTNTGGRIWSFNTNTAGTFLIRDQTAGGVTRIAIDSTGNVGLGTAAATSFPNKLTVMDTVNGLTTGLGISSFHVPHVTAGGAINSFDLGPPASARPLALQTNGGNVGIGVTAPVYRLELPNNANASGQGRANAWVTYSSKRWKKNITPIDDALAKVMQLRGVYFDPREGGPHDIGLIAEEVGKVVPEVVKYEKDGENAAGITYDRLVAVLIEAVKQQQAEIENQRKEIEELKTKVDLTSSGR